MPIPVKCETCGYKAKANDDASGKITRCPKCGKLIHIPDLNWVNETDFKEAGPPPFVEPLPVIEEPPKPGSRERQFDHAKWLRRIKLAAFGLSSVMFLATLHTTEVVPHYAALIIVLGIAASYFLRNAGDAYRRIATPLIVVMLVWLWWQNDYYMESWEQPSDLSGRLVFNDYLRRGSTSQYYRDFWQWFDQKDGGGYFHAKGYFSESGKQHGPWTQYHSSGPIRRLWYWYGEEITEGDWHLRDK